MTDKQIIIYKKECYNEPYCSLNQVLEQLKAKEQECEAYKMEAEEGKEINAELKAENDLFRTCHDNEQAKRRNYEQTLAEIKPILELYANSKFGEEQPDRTYKIMLSGGYIMAYDPRPAREGLKKISEVEDGV